MRTNRKEETAHSKNEDKRSDLDERHGGDCTGSSKTHRDTHRALGRKEGRGLSDITSDLRSHTLALHAGLVSCVSQIFCRERHKRHD